MQVYDRKKIWPWEVAVSYSCMILRGQQIFDIGNRVTYRPLYQPPDV
jgi:hypothetical protein